MFFRILFALIFFVLLMTEAFSQTETEAPPVDVNVINTPEVRVANKIQIDPEEEVSQVDAPVFDDALSMQTIMQPLFDWKQSFVSSIVVPSVVGECPTSSIYLFGRNVRLSSHCSIFADVAPVLSPACLLFYVCFAGVIILRA